MEGPSWDYDNAFVVTKGSLFVGGGRGIIRPRVCVCVCGCVCTVWMDLICACTMKETEIIKVTEEHCGWLKAMSSARQSFTEYSLGREEYVHMNSGAFSQLWLSALRTTFGTFFYCNQTTFQFVVVILIGNFKWCWKCVNNNTKSIVSLN